MALSDEDVLTLGQSSPGLRHKILSKYSRGSAGVTAVFASKVAQVGLAPDTLSEDVLLTLVAPNGVPTTYSLTPEIARILIDRLPHFVSLIETAKMAKQ